MKKYAVLLIILLVSSFAKAEFKFAGDVKSASASGDRVEFVLSNALLNVYIIDDNIIRFRYTTHRSFSEAPSYAVIKSGNKKVEFDFKEEKSYYLVKTSNLNVEISKTPCRVSVFDKNMNLIDEDSKAFGAAFDGNEVRCFKKLFHGEMFYGLGEKTGPLNKRGFQYTMWNTDSYKYRGDSDPLYLSIPFFIGIRDHNAYGIFLDNTYRSYFNMGASNNRFYWFGAAGGELDYYFIYGPEIKKIISDYTSLTGRMEMPPLWALGYQQSKYSYYPESDVRRVAETFREKKIPCDVIYLDIAYMNGYRVFTWDNNGFPDPAGMISDLKNEGFKIVPIIDPGVKADTNYFAAREGVKKDVFAKYPDGKLYEGEVWPSWAYFPDFTKKETRDWWGGNLSILLKQGVEGFWNDMNEPSVWGQAFPDIVVFNDNGYVADHKKIHNVYALEEAKATHDEFLKFSPNKRHFMLTRAGFSGIQRYSAVWTGDNVSDVEHLRLALSMPLEMGLSGVPFTGSDVGGFVGVPSPQLYTRWMELGAFTPFFRGHSAINQKDKEPWAFGFKVERNVRNVIELRYKLLPFLYNEFHNASVTGLPIMRPMFLDFQNDDECYSYDAQEQFMIGKNLLVAPVLDDNSVYKKLYLPEGKWIDWWTEKVYEGGQWIVVNAPAGTIPLFIRGGGIIPMQKVLQYTDQEKITELKFRIFPSASGEYELYRDDGISYDYKKGGYSITKITTGQRADSGNISIEKTYDHYKSGINDYLLEVLNTSGVSGVSVNGIQMALFDNLNDLEHAEEGFCTVKSRKTLYIKVKNTGDLKVTYRF